MIRENKWEFEAQLVRYDEDASMAWFHFDLGFGVWHTQRVKVRRWHPQGHKPGQHYRVFVDYEKKEEEPYTVTVWYREAGDL